MTPNNESDVPLIQTQHSLDCRYRWVVDAVGLLWHGLKQDLVIIKWKD